MKKTLFYIAIMGLVVLMGACSREQGNVFDKSAAERLQEAQEKVTKALLGAPQGWEMRYFANPSSPGYVYLCSFSDNGSVQIAAKNNVNTAGAYKTETSCWTTDGTQGCVLTFNTYNTIFHDMADPGSDGVGHEGDYEFVVLKTTDSQILLKGKKHSAYITMNALPVGQDWKAYFDKVDEFNDVVFTGNTDVDMSFCNGDTTYNMIYKDGYFTYSKNGEDKKLGFIVTPDGLHFYGSVPMTDSTQVVADFVLNDEQSQLVSKDVPGVFFTSNYSAADFFRSKFEKSARWVYAEEGTDATTVAAVNAIKARAAAKGATIQRLAYERYTTLSAKGVPSYSYTFYVAYTVESKVFEGKIEMNYKNADGKVTFSYKNSDGSLNALLRRLNETDTKAAAKEIADIFSDEFIPESYTGSTLNMVQILLRSSSNSAKYIHVISDNETK